MGGVGVGVGVGVGMGVGVGGGAGPPTGKQVHLVRNCGGSSQ